MRKARALLFFVAGVVWLAAPAIAASQAFTVQATAFPEAPSQQAATAGAEASAEASATAGTDPMVITPTTPTVQDVGAIPTPRATGLDVTSRNSLVPCGGPNDPLGCDLCDLGQLMQNIINFMIAMSIPIAAAMFAYAGFLFVTGASNPEQINKARKVFSQVLIGFLIAISAWLVVQTMLSKIFDDTFWIGDNWNELKCISQSTSNPGGGGRLIGTNFGDLINTIVPQPPPPTINVISGTSYSCSIGTYSPQTNSCVDADGKIIGAPSATQVQSIPVGTGTRGYAQCPQGNPHCSTSILRAQGLSLAQANAASCIAFSENAGLAAGCSGTGPCGAFQISQTNWKAYAPAGCAAADFGGNIARAQNDGQCNMKTAVIMMGELGYQPWTGNHPGLPPWNPAARTCVSNYDPANL